MSPISTSGKVVLKQTWQLADSDAAAYVAAVEAADGQAIEPNIRFAIHSFVVGCKADGIWDAIKASCILAGARTLAGALVPLKGTAPTNYNFVSADYNRKTGLKGNVSAAKYLDSNRANNADPQNSNHNAAYISEANNLVTGHIIGSDALASTGGNSIYSVYSGSASNSGCWSRSNGSTQTIIGATNVALTNFVGTSRSSSSSFDRRANGTTSSASVISSTPTANNVLVFARGTPVASYANARLSFYSIGESLDLALLDSRVSTLMTDIGAAI